MLDQANQENEMTSSVVLLPPAEMEAITLNESQRLIELEKVISAEQQLWIEAGKALDEIRDTRLYRSDFSTFEKYCEQKWGFTKQHAYRLITCAPIAESNPQVTSMNQARALAKVPEEKRAEVMQVATTKATAAGRELTANDILAVMAPPPTHKAVVALKKNVAQELGPLPSKKIHLQCWYSEASPEKRGQFMNSIFSMPVQIEDMADFKTRVSHWLEHKVSSSRHTSPLPASPTVLNENAQ